VAPGEPGEKLMNVDSMIWVASMSAAIAREYADLSAHQIATALISAHVLADELADMYEAGALGSGAAELIEGSIHEALAPIGAQAVTVRAERYGASVKFELPHDENLGIPQWFFVCEPANKD